MVIVKVKPEISEERRQIWQIADDIANNWLNMYYGAIPFVDSLSVLRSTEDQGIHGSGRDTIKLFLKNSRTWHGEDAKRLKRELRYILVHG